MNYLHEQVKAQYPGQIDKVRYLVDGAGYHKSISSRQYFRDHGLKVILLAPYSYKTNC